ncbi:MAG: hypothetical protein WCZ28_08010 [Burkholderiaceae bacterium]
MRPPPAAARPIRTRPAAVARLALGLLLAALATQAVASDFPKRRPGLWEVRQVGADAAGLPASLHCVGEHSDSAEHHLGRTPGVRGVCRLGPFVRAGDAWVAESVCREGKTVVSSRKIAIGDFRSHYRIDTVVRYEPPLAGVRDEDKDALEAKYLGPCDPGMRPGDMVMPGMGILNLDDGTLRKATQR